MKMSLICNWKICLLLLSAIGPLSNGFTSSTSGRNRLSWNQAAQWRSPPVSPIVSLDAAGKKRKRRRRKDEPASTSPEPEVAPPQQQNEKLEAPSKIEGDSDKDGEEEISKEDLFLMKEIANFEFESDGPAVESPEPSEGAIPLPDIKEALKKKEEEVRAKIEEEQLKAKRRIKRSDKEAFTKLLEQQPYADADDSFFEQEEYTTVSALLGEGSKPFLGIPTGPLQVGHFIGALGIMLCAFIDYPGFPLTNLPTPLRDSLQGGLAVTYAINLVLAIVAVFKAGERGQPTLLWVAKTFTVGGLAYDQLMQLPTVDQIQRAKKGRK